MRIEIYVQARMGSTRLPGKVMKKVMGKPLLEFLIERLKQVRGADGFAILTSTHPADTEIVDFCQAKGVLCYRGPEEDVLTRYHRVATQRAPDAIVRITADCPLIDPDIIDQVIQMFRDGYPAYDYISTGIERTFPRGLDVEIMSLEALDQAFHRANDPSEREHVTLYIYRHPELFKLKNFSSETPLAHHRWTVDTPEDFELIKLILENLYPIESEFRLRHIVTLLESHPEWSQINAHIRQKLT